MTEARVCVEGHFGEWLQGLAGPGGPVVLVTLPCPALRVEAPAVGDGHVVPFGKAQLDEFAEELNLRRPLSTVSRNMALGAGAGASTATLIAIARAGGYLGTADRLAQACLAVEGATDPLMHGRPDGMLWASREARVVKRLPVPPEADIIGGFLGAPVRTDPGDLRFPVISDLIQAWESAVRARDLSAVAELAGMSSHRSAILRGEDDTMPALCRETGALGHVRAHTGSARGLVFAPDTAPKDVIQRLERAGLTSVISFRTGGE